MFGNFSSMTAVSFGSFHNSSSTSTFQSNSTSSYTVLYSPKTGASAFKVNFTQSSPAATAIMWIQPNGMVIAVYMSGVNATGTAALNEAGSITSPFPVVFQYGTVLQSYLAIPGVHQLNTTSLTLGPTTMTVTNYGITSPNSFCNGNGVISESSFNLQAGTVSGTTMTLVPLWSVNSTFSPTGASWVLSSSSTTRVLSVTKA